LIPDLKIIQMMKRQKSPTKKRSCPLGNKRKIRKDLVEDDAFGLELERQVRNQ
jgi:hypothetical protein